MRFLIDECLSIDLVSIAGQAGHEAQHVARVGKAGWKDWNVARHAAEAAAFSAHSTSWLGSGNRSIASLRSILRAVR